MFLFPKYRTNCALRFLKVQLPACAKRILDYTNTGDNNRKLCSLYFSILDKMDATLPKFGNAESRLADIYFFKLCAQRARLPTPFYNRFASTSAGAIFSPLEFKA